ncbi:MCE family protein [Nocardia wallacei]|uniref:MCE family protein n=1 Tax=Nocardia wallacei TaxID=480035 RepID=UPI0024559A1E|nr:MCE family protein [Nocardia wallacei]
MRKTARSLAGAAVLTATISVTVAGCRFDGVNSISLPGNNISGRTYEVTVELADAQNLVGNSPVKAENAVIGNIARITSRGWTASLRLDIDADAHLPANVTARLAQTSVLGSQYLELSVPPGQQPTGTLKAGDVIPLARTSQYPSTEEVLSALSLVLNGSGLQQIQTVTTELNRVLDGRQTSLRSLIDNLQAFVSGLDQQKADIVAAIDGLDRLGSELAAQTGTIEDGIDSLAPAIAVVNDQQQQLTTMLNRVGDFGSVATRVLNAGSADLHANIAALQPALTQLAQAGDKIPEALKIAATVPFPVMTTERALRGDYMNLFLTLDVSPATIGGKVLGSIPVDQLIRLNPARQATDPLLAPSVPAPAGPHIPTLEEVLTQLQGGAR